MSRQMHDRCSVPDLDVKILSTTTGYLDGNAERKIEQKKMYIFLAGGNDASVHVYTIPDSRSSGYFSASTEPNKFRLLNLKEHTQGRHHGPKGICTTSLEINQLKDHALFAATDNGFVIKVDAVRMLRTMNEKDKESRNNLFKYLKLIINLN